MDGQWFSMLNLVNGWGVLSFSILNYRPESTITEFRDNFNNTETVPTGDLAQRPASCSLAWTTLSED